MVIHNRYLSSPDIPGYSIGSILSPRVLHAPVINWDGKKMRTEWSLRLRWDGLGALLEESQLSRSSSHWLYVVTRKGGLWHAAEYGFMVHLNEAGMTWLWAAWHGYWGTDLWSSGWVGSILNCWPISSTLRSWIILSFGHTTCIYSVLIMCKVHCYVLWKDER